MRGQGFAQESGTAVTLAAHAFGVERLWATVRTTNAPSLAVLASLGYSYVRTEKDDRGALAYYCSADPAR
jgi:RimJ/RimL family protein N-acetyltransferase